MKNKTIVHGAVYVLGNILNKASAFMILPIITRMMTIEEYGVLNTYSSWVLMITPVVGLSMSASVRNAYVDMRDELGKYLSSIFFLAFLNTGAIITVYTIFRGLVRLPCLLIYFCILESFSKYIIESLINECVVREWAVRRNVLLVFPNLIGNVLSVVVIYFMESKKYYGKVIPLSLSLAAFAFYYIIRYWTEFKSFYNSSYWKYAISISLPLILHGISINILHASDKSMISYFRGTSETGIYSLIYSISMMTNAVSTALEAICIPRLIKGLKVSDYISIRKDVFIFMHTLIFMFCGILTVAPEAILFFGGRKYMSGYNMVSPLVISSFLISVYSIYINIEYYYKKTKGIALATVTSALINVILNFIFVPQYGAVAAAYTTLVSFLASVIMHRVMARRIDDKIAPDFIMFEGLVMVVVSSVLTNLLSKRMMFRWGLMIIIGTLYAVICYRKYKKLLV